MVHTKPAFKIDGGLCLLVLVSWSKFHGPAWSILEYDGPGLSNLHGPVCGCWPGRGLLIANVWFPANEWRRGPLTPGLNSHGPVCASWAKLHGTFCVPSRCFQEARIKRTTPTDGQSHPCRLRDSLEYTLKETWCRPRDSQKYRWCRLRDSQAH